ncbi:hypothetical protein HJG43_02010 [Kineosporiaceae bacterium SCSIO 59966]|nr:hypothetical protein HJG43_02010 [Kineosporiaceae bacterium SCSIO 59966]
MPPDRPSPASSPQGGLRAPFEDGDPRHGERLLDVALVLGFDDMDEEEIRARRDETQTREDRVSYVRRLLQGRLDVLIMDRQRRQRAEDGVYGSGARTMQELVASLAPALAETSARVAERSVGSVEAVTDSVEECEAAALDPRTSVPASLSDEGLQAAIERITQLERGISRLRHSLHEVIDAANAELDRRMDEVRLNR